MYIHVYIYFNLKCVLLVLIHFICLMSRIQRSSTFLGKKRKKILFLILDEFDYIFSVIGILMVTIRVVQKLTVLQRARKQMFQALSSLNCLAMPLNVKVALRAHQHYVRTPASSHSQQQLVCFVLVFNLCYSSTVWQYLNGLLIIIFTMTNDFEHICHMLIYYLSLFQLVYIFNQVLYVFQN